MGAFLRELKRRRVFRVAAAYLVAAWVVIQVASIVAPALHLPDALITGIIVVALLGLPIAVALAWAFDVTPSGVTRDPVDTATSTPQLRPYRRPAVIGLAGMALVVSAAAVFAVLRQRTAAAPGASNEQARTIAIMPFAVRGSDRVAHMSNGMVDLLATDLTRAGDLEAVDPHALLAAIGNRIIDPDAARDLARRFNAGLYVLGSIVEAEGRVRLTASLYDRSRGARPLLSHSADGAVGDLLKLAQELGGRLAAGVPAADDASLSASLVWSGPDVDDTGTLSADGRWLSFTDWVTGDLAVRDLASGISRRLTDKGAWSVSDEYAETSAISRDGRHIAYAWVDSSYRYHLRVTSRDGTGRRLVYSAETSEREVGWLMPSQWSADGSAVLVQHWIADETTARWVNIRDGSHRTVARFGRSTPGRFLLSPDGRWLALTLPQSPGSVRNDIFVMPASGGDWTGVVQSPAHDELLAWSPDGARLFFWSDRGVAPGIWSVPVAGARAAGAPTLVRAEMSWLLPVGIAGDDFHYAVRASEVQVHLAELDVERARLVAPPQRTAHETAPTTLTPLFEPGGARIAYVVESARGQRGAGVLAVLDPTKGAVVEYPLGLTFAQAAQWLGNGTILLWGGRGGAFGYYALDLDSGELRSYDLGEGSTQQLVVSADGLTQFFVRWAGATRTITARDVQSGRERVLVQDTAGGGLALSHDQRTLFFAQRRAGRDTELRAVSVSGGASRLVHRLPPHESFVGFRPTRDGRHIVYISSSVDDDAPHELRVFSMLDGRERHVLTLEGMRHLQLHPDGRHILFSAGRARIEMWKLAGLGRALE